MTSVDGATTQISSQRPLPPIALGRLIVPLGVLVASVASAGIVGTGGATWGALIGLAFAAVLGWKRFLRYDVSWAALIAAGAATTLLFNDTLRSRTTVIEWQLSVRASLVWLIFGTAVGWVLARHVPEIKPLAVVSRTVVTAAAFAAAAFLALQVGTAIGYIPLLRTRQIEANTIQLLSSGFYVQLGAVVALLGGTAALAIRTQKAIIFGIAAAVVLTVISFNQVGFSVRDIWNSFPRVGILLGEFWPPDWTWSRSLGQPEKLQIVGPLVETLQIAIIGATLGCIAAIPIAFCASQPTTPNSAVYQVAKNFMNVIRTIPDLFWGVLFATAVGFGAPFAGALAMFMFSLAIMAKLFSETVDTVDLGPLEASLASGASHWSMVQYAAFPQVSPHYVAYALYIFELNIRASVVLGIVGAGGIGRLLDERRSFFEWDQVMAIVLVIFTAVIVIEIFSIWVRRKIV